MTRWSQQFMPKNAEWIPKHLIFSLFFFFFFIFSFSSKIFFRITPKVSFYAIRNFFFPIQFVLFKICHLHLKKFLTIARGKILLLKFRLFFLIPCLHILSFIPKNEVKAYDFQKFSCIFYQFCVRTYLQHFNLMI